MVRNLLGSFIALIGAAVAVWSPFHDWYGTREGQDIRVQDPFTGITSTIPSDLWVSVMLPMLVAALLTLIGVVFRSRLVVAIAGLLILGYTVLWMVRQGMELGSLTAGGDGGLGAGAGLAVAGGVLVLIGSLVMRGRKPRGRARHGLDGPETPEDDLYGGPPTVATDYSDYRPRPDDPWPPQDHRRSP
ncbi:hypothetical protein [Streptomyces sp. NPDC047108]|uniref:hypothetical protein n=1 Tax=Streptomyces sp. NPDC047108 TaxID=3155025 RepID=UPI0033F99BFC